jgi:ribosomal protein S24E
MKVDIIDQKKNPLLKRDEIRARIGHPGKPTPNRKEILAVLAKALKAGEDRVIVDKIFTRKALPESEAHALVYKKKEDIPKDKLEKMERRTKKAEKPKEEKAAPAEEGAKPEAKPEEKAEEAPEKKEEAKEEKKAEEKKEETPKEEEKKE